MSKRSSGPVSNPLPKENPRATTGVTFVLTIAESQRLTGDIPRRLVFSSANVSRSSAVVENSSSVLQSIIDAEAEAWFSPFGINPFQNSLSDEPARKRISDSDSRSSKVKEIEESSALFLKSFLFSAISSPTAYASLITS